MIKLLFVLLSFLKEFVFDKKEEFDIRNTNFNIKLAVLFISLSLSLFLNVWLITKEIELTKKSLKIRKENVSLSKSVDELKQSNQSCLDEKLYLTNEVDFLLANFKTCMSSVKKTR